MSEETQALGSEERKQSDSKPGIIITPKNFGNLKGGNTVPIKIVDNLNLRANDISQPLKNSQLMLGKGVEIIMKDNVVYIKSKSWFMYFFGIAAIISAIAMIIAAMILHKPEKEIIIKEKQVNVAIPAKEKKSKKAALVDSIDEEDQKVKTFKSLEEVFEVIEYDPEASIQVFKEAVSLRKEGNKEEEFDKKRSLKLFKQAIMRLRALLQKGEITNYYRLQTAYQLWAIYRCHLTKYKKAERKMRTLVKTYNKGAKRKVKLSCPKL